MLTISLYATLTMLTTAVLIAFVRVVRGPSLPDRVVAADLIGSLVVGCIVVGAAAAGEQTLLDAAIVIALVGFLGTVAYARYVEENEERP